MPAGFQIVDHVADVRVRAWGTCFQEAFSEITKGMWFLMFGGSSIPALDKWSVEVRGIDMEDLLIGFLNEQLALFDIEGLAVSGTEEIIFEESPDGEEICLKSVMCGAHISQVNVRPDLQIKAATFHRLKLTPTEACVTFDV